MSVHVLVVDDDEDIRFLTAIALETTAGWEVATAADGYEGIAQATMRTPDVILLDLMMPGLDGLATVERMRAEPGLAEVPIVLFTAKAATGDRAPWADAAISGVLTKPYDPMLLADSVRELLGW